MLAPWISVACLVAYSSAAPSGLAIPEAPTSHLLELQAHPEPKSIRRGHNSAPSFKFGNHPYGGGPWGGHGGGPGGRHHGQGDAIVNTIFSGVYPVVNVTWGGNKGEPSQTFISFIDTGSADTFAVGKGFQCVDIATKVPLDEAACGFGPLYSQAEGKFTNITDLEFQIMYFPEGEVLQGSMGYASITVAGLTVPKQEVALVDYAAWAGDTYTSGLFGLAYPLVTSAYKRSNLSEGVPYDPWFITAYKEKIVERDVFSLAVNRVPPGTAVNAPAGLLALGGLVPPYYYEGPFTTVPIEATEGTGTDDLTFYTTTTEFLYGKTDGKIVSGGTFQAIVDSGTAPNFIPTPAADDLNKQFVPPAVYNATLGYWVVDCDAKAPYAAFKIGGKVMPMDPRDMIVPSLNGLVGYENVCFSAFGDGGDITDAQLIGEVWQHGYVVVYDQGKKQLHFADRRPY